MATTVIECIKVYAFKKGVCLLGKTELDKVARISSFTREFKRILFLYFCCNSTITPNEGERKVQATQLLEYASNF